MTLSFEVIEPVIDPSVQDKNRAKILRFLTNLRTVLEKSKCHQAGNLDPFRTVPMGIIHGSYAHLPPRYFATLQEIGI